MDVYVTIIGSKICYGTSAQELTDYVAAASANPGHFHGCLTTAWPPIVKMDEAQFVRFKNAGKQHASKAPGKSMGGISRDRADRTQSDTLEKWDVGPYGSLTGRKGPWGGGMLTNRDHMTANSANQIQFSQGNWSGSATSSNAVKNEGLAITVSGRHHREASYTYGGRTKKTDTPDGSTRTEYAASHTTESYQTETVEMLAWKADHIGRGGVPKNTLRLEMVGAYIYMYKLAILHGHIQASIQLDQFLLHYLQAAVANE